MVDNWDHKYYIETIYNQNVKQLITLFSSQFVWT